MGSATKNDIDRKLTMETTEVWKAEIGKGLCIDNSYNRSINGSIYPFPYGS
jgi:hypothetical protein